MQQRYCTCGQAIWVHYFPAAPSNHEALFTQRQNGDELLCVCPHCGYTLNINEMA